MTKIANVMIFKNGGASIRYKSGKSCDYSMNTLPQSAMDFILQENVKAYENDFFTIYKEV